MGTRHRTAVPAIGALVLLAIVVAATTVSRAPSVVVEAFTVEVPASASRDDASTVRLDAALHVPSSATARTPRPAVLLAHGFLGDRTSTDGRARELARDGWIVLTWSSRGFGDSGGHVGLVARDAEVADVSHLVDLLAERDDVALDAQGDPRVAIIGASHGAGVALMAAAHDARLDAVIAIAGWHDLGEALAPGGVLKTAWAGLLFTARTTTDGERSPSACGSFSEPVCDAYLDVATTGLMTDETSHLLAGSSPSGRLGFVTAPTLLVQGTRDSLFGLDQARAAAAEIAATGTAVRQRWVPAGHEQFTGSSWPPDVIEEVDTWLDQWLGRQAMSHDATLTWTDDVSGRRVDLSGAFPESTDVLDLRLEPGGLVARDDESRPADARDVVLISPPGGQPAARSSLPGSGALGRLLPVVDVPGQHVHLTTEPLPDDVVLFGAPTLTVQVDATSRGLPSTEARLFVRLHDIAPDGTSRLVNQQVTPVRVVDPPARIEVSLGTVAHRIASGHRLRLTIATTDQAFANLRVPTMVTLVTSADSRLELPTLPDTPDRSTVPWSTILVGAALVTGLVVGFWRRGSRWRRPTTDDGHVRTTMDGKPDPDGPAIVLAGLTKRYAHGPPVVRDLDLVIERGQVMGLLGPNGAGKTSTLRMLVGLAHPTAGTIDVFGHRMRPGHAVLGRVGCLIEGPGFLPTLSGLDNLRLYWRSGGRPLDEAHLPWALDLADLGDDIRRPVRSYSHGMRQRLGIAQALLGRPDLLVLDEPTDGLDPEQIVRLRSLLRDIGSRGHTVLVSSHLLAEVEQTCTHVAVMHRGTLRTVGPVEDVVRDATRVAIDTDDPVRAHDVLRRAFGDLDVSTSEQGVVVEAPGIPTGDLVRTLVVAGISVRAVLSRGSLEEAFLNLTTEPRSTER